MTLVYQGTEPGRPATNSRNLRSNNPFLLDFRRKGAGFAFSTWQIQLLLLLSTPILLPARFPRTFVLGISLDVYGLLRIDDFQSANSKSRTQHSFDLNYFRLSVMYAGERVYVSLVPENVHSNEALF
jgi:hypothetical protein